MTDKIDAIAVLFSGGCDSTLAAAIAAEKYGKVHLLTYKRLGIFKMRRPRAMVEKLRKRYPGCEFHYECIDINKYHKEICYENYFSNVSRYGLKLVSVCGLCNVAMHWRTVLYCLDSGIRCVSDGANAASNTFPSQNKKIMIGGLRKMYSHFGIEYSNPVYEMGDNVEEELYRRGITACRKIKQTERDSQPVCIDNLLFSRFVDFYLHSHSWEEYEEDLKKFYDEKIEYAVKRIEEERGAIKCR
jgi:hypothetical protein